MKNHKIPLVATFTTADTGVKWSKEAKARCAGVSPEHGVKMGSWQENDKIDRNPPIFKTQMRLNDHIEAGMFPTAMGTQTRAIPPDRGW
jgi:hypothetical protein